MTSFLVNVIATIIVVGLAGLLLLAGRKYLWILLGVGGLLVSAAIIAEIQGSSGVNSLIQNESWILLVLALGIGILCVGIAQRNRNLAIDLIGFGAGVYVASWFDEIILAVSGSDTTDFTWWIALILAGCGVIGVLLTRRDREQALILISVIIGATTIGRGLGLDPSNSFTAVVVLGLALTGVVVQYASFLRENPRIGSQLPPVPHPVSEELPFN